ncbi:MAG: hypothetical protein ACJ8EL_13885 [Rhizomicrobium sp.]
MDAINDSALLGVVLKKRGGQEGNRNATSDKYEGDNVTFVPGVDKDKSSRGNSAEYVASRLDRDGHTDLAADVRAGRMSANAAAKQVGYPASRSYIYS